MGQRREPCGYRIQQASWDLRMIDPTCTKIGARTHVRTSLGSQECRHIGVQHRSFGVVEWHGRTDNFIKSPCRIFSKTVHDMSEV